MKRRERLLPDGYHHNIAINDAASANTFNRILPNGALPTGWSSRQIGFSGGSIWSRNLTIPDRPLANGTMQYDFTTTNAAGTATSPLFGGIEDNSCKP